MTSDLRAGSVAKLVFNLSFGIGDSQLLPGGDVGGTEGERSELKRFFDLVNEEIDDEEDDADEEDDDEDEDEEDNDREDDNDDGQESN